MKFPALMPSPWLSFALNNSTSSFITGEKRFQVPKTTRDIFKHAMNQELLNMMILEKDVVKKNASVQKKPVKV